jgi:hypothetical protein
MAFDLDMQSAVDPEQHLCMPMNVLAPFAVIASDWVGVHRGQDHRSRISVDPL